VLSVSNLVKTKVLITFYLRQFSRISWYHSHQHHESAVTED